MNQLLEESEQSIRSLASRESVQANSYFDPLPEPQEIDLSIYYEDINPEDDEEYENRVLQGLEDSLKPSMFASVSETGNIAMEALSSSVIFTSEAAGTVTNTSASLVSGGMDLVSSGLFSIYNALPSMRSLPSCQVDLASCKTLIENNLMSFLSLSGKDNSISTRAELCPKMLDQLMLGQLTIDGVSGKNHQELTDSFMSLRLSAKGDSSINDKLLIQSSRVLSDIITQVVREKSVDTKTSKRFGPEGAAGLHLNLSLENGVLKVKFSDERAGFKFARIGEELLSLSGVATSYSCKAELNIKYLSDGEASIELLNGHREIYLG